MKTQSEQHSTAVGQEWTGESLAAMLDEYGVHFAAKQINAALAAERKPLVDLLNRANECLKHTEYKDTIVPEISDALAKGGEIKLTPTRV